MTNLRLGWLVAVRDFKALRRWLLLKRCRAEQRLGVVAAHPRGNHFNENIIDAFYHGMAHRPDSTFGTVNDDVLAFKNPKFERADFCKIILNSAWEA
jgi:hypothetical protein